MEDVGDDEEDDKITADDADVRDDAQQVHKGAVFVAIRSQIDDAVSLSAACRCSRSTLGPCTPSASIRWTRALCSRAAATMSA